MRSSESTVSQILGSNRQLLGLLLGRQMYVEGLVECCCWFFLLTLTLSNLLCGQSAPREN